MSEQVDLEVARFALRTFNLEVSSSIEDYEHKPGPFQPKRTLKRRRYAAQMNSVGVPSGAWENGVCEAHCLWQWMCSDTRWLTMVSGDPPPFHKALRLFPPSHEAPQLNCSCGIYGSLSLETLREQYVDQSKKCLAVIAAEGRTIIGNRGLRTQFARVVAVWAEGETDRRALVTTCPGVKEFADYMDMLNEYGIPVEAAVKGTDTVMGPYWA